MVDGDALDIMVIPDAATFQVLLIVAPGFPAAYLTAPITLTLAGFKLRMTVLVRWSPSARCGALLLPIGSL
jgi:hypothetical protein